MSDHFYALFDTVHGPCGITWGINGIVATQLPEKSPEATVNRLLRYRDAIKAEPKGEALSAIAGIQSLLADGKADLRAVSLDMSGVPDFNASVYRLVREILPGETKRYGDIALALGDKSLSQAVGAAMGSNPFAPIIPCHRVVAANGMPGGFSAGGGVDTKLKMLRTEQARNVQFGLFDQDLSAG